MTRQKFKIDKRCELCLCPHITREQANAFECDTIGFVNNKTQILEQYFLVCDANGPCGEKLRAMMLKSNMSKTLKNFTAVRLKRGEWSVLP